jgi:hypothetical protein
MSTAKRLTPNKIANLVMADEAWHDSEYVAASDYDALRAKFDRLVEYVEKAPHASMTCTSHTVQPDGFALPARCGCWKRAVLAEEGR